MTPTPRQMVMLRFIHCYQLTHAGQSPSYREIAAGIEATSNGDVHRLIEGCAERGLLRKQARLHRSIELLIVLPVSRAPDGALLYFVPVESLHRHNSVDTGDCCGASSGKPAQISSEDRL